MSTNSIDNNHLAYDTKKEQAPKKRGAIKSRLFFSGISFLITLAVLIALPKDMVISRFFIGISIGLLISAIIEYLIKKYFKREIKNKLVTNFKVITNNLFSVACFLLYACFTIYFIINYTASQTPMLAASQSLIINFSITIFVFYSITTTLSMINSGSILSITRSLSFGVKLALYSAISVCAISKYGEDALNWININPSDSISLALGFIILYFVCKLSLPAPIYTIINHTNSTMTCKKPSKPMSLRDRNLVAAHEAGHAIMFSLLDELPTYLHASIGSSDKHKDSLGRVTGLDFNLPIESKRESEIRMLILLAGQVSERVLLDNNTNGSKKDLEKWMLQAKLYLSNGFSGLFYPNPENNYEFTSNEEKIKALKEKQISLITDFLVTNKVVLTTIYQALLTNNSIDRAEFEVIFTGIQGQDII